MSIRSDILEAVALGELIESLGIEIARAQLAMDMTSLRLAEAMAERNVDFDGTKVSVLEMGLTPGFYQFVETTVELKITVTTMEESSSERSTSDSKTTEEESGGASASFLFWSASTPKKTTTTTSTLDTRSSTRFQHGSESSSMLRSKIIPVPPPGAIMDRLRVKDAK